MKFVYPDSATPIDPDEAEALLPEHITTQRELNAWESLNILQATRWGLSRKHVDYLSSEFVRVLHGRMFNKTWAWAGTYRKSDKNIGVPWQTVATEIFKAVGDARYWLDETVYDGTETALRLHYRMVVIHPFVNGNGRHARLLADILLFNLDLPHIHWGGTELDSVTEKRSRYLAALRAADRGHFAPLLSYRSG